MDAIFEYARKRAVSTILVSYTVFWAIFHWQGIYATVFIDQNIIYKQHGLLKNEYVNKYFFGFDWSNILTIHNLDILLGWIIPAGLAYFYIWWLPKFVINPAYKREIGYKEQRRIEKTKSEKRIQDEERKLIEKQTATEEAKIELADKKAEVSAGWERDYQDFITNEKAVSSFNELLRIVYNRNSIGQTESVSKMDPDSLMMVEALDLIDATRSSSIRLTDKGKYFARRYKVLQNREVKG
jgi:hypothetical protein